jgi:hypothetical protein
MATVAARFSAIFSGSLITGTVEASRGGAGAAVRRPHGSVGQPKQRLRPQLLTPAHNSRFAHRHLGASIRDGAVSGECVATCSAQHDLN